MPTLQLFVCLSILCVPASRACLDSTCTANATSPSGTSVLQRASLVQRVQPHAHHESQTAQPQHRFPFERVFFSHVPKVGGYTMRGALRDLCKTRGQKLQVCYVDVKCNASVSKDLMAMEDTVVGYDATSAENQIVYGHGVRANFEQVWGFDQSDNNAHIAVLREPISLLLSAWGCQNRNPIFPNYNLSLNEWIERGKAEAFVDYYASFFVDIQVPDPWDLFVASAFQPSTGTSVLASNPAWRELLTVAVQAPNRLVLLQDNWETSVARLAEFLQLTEEERIHMLSVLGDVHMNVAGDADINIKKSNLIRLTRAAEPLQFLYGKVRELHHAPAVTPAASPEAALR